MPTYLLQAYAVAGVLAVLAFVAAYFLAAFLARRFDSPHAYRLHLVARVAGAFLFGGMSAGGLWTIVLAYFAIFVAPAAIRPTADARTQLAVVLIAAVLAGAAAIFRIETWYRGEIGMGAGKRATAEGETEWRVAEEPRS